MMRSRPTDADEELFRRIHADGDTAALKSLFERYYQALCRFSASIVRDDEGAQENVADVFAELWIKRSSIHIRCSVKQYLYGAVRNRSLNALRSLGMRTESLESGASSPAGPEFEADHLLLYNEMSSDIDALLDRMPERRRLIFRMSRIDGLTYQEIAEVLSISPSTVQNQMVEAVKFLSLYSHFNQ